MLEKTVQSFNALLDPGWSRELAGILPLSALIDFVDMPRILHIFQLTGLIPLWCWPITPSGSRLLLADDNNKANNACCLDRYGQSLGLTCLDGRYGDEYLTPNPTTLRLALGNLPIKPIANPHENMRSSHDNRLQTLQVIRVDRMPHQGRLRQARLFMVTNVLGWLMYSGLIALCIIMSLWLALAFLVAVPSAGLLVTCLHGNSGGRPRRLGRKAQTGSQHNRLVVAAQHMNESEWFVFYGESSVVNALLNWPIMPPAKENGEMTASTRGSMLARHALRGIALVQWATALGAAATKTWDAYILTFWIVFCIFAHSYAFSPEQGARSWLKHFAGVKLDRYQVQVSSRRALLNTIVALNPDTFAAPGANRTDGEKKGVDNGDGVDYSCLNSSGMLWIDPILRRCEDRTKWEECTRVGMLAAAAKADEAKGDGDGKTWDDLITHKYWREAIREGIEVAAMVKREARLSGRLVMTC